MVVPPRDGPALVKTILLIEDDPALLRLEQTILRDSGYTAESVGDAEQARVKVRATPYHGIVLDLSAAGADGYALAGEIGTAGANRHTPLILVGADEPDGRKRAFEAGAMAFLPRPFTAEAFRAVLHSVVSPAGPRPPGSPRAPSARGGHRAAPVAWSPPPPAVARAGPRAPAPAPAPASTPAPRAEDMIPVSYQGGPVYWCEPDAEGWRCGRCELGLIGAAEAGSTCSICQAAVLSVRGGSRGGLGWLVLLFVVLLLVLGWLVVDWPALIES
jgi:CheY-like chemotaxis protein